MRCKLYALLATLLLSTLSIAQIVSISPNNPTIDDTITITYDASLGNQVLLGQSPVYIHTGVITDQSSPGEWLYVQGVWGTADPNVLMTDLGNNLHLSLIHI